MHGLSTVDGRVTAAERERLVAAHGREAAERMIAEEEAAYGAPPRLSRKPTNNGLRPRRRAASDSVGPAAEAAAGRPSIPTSETEE